MDRSLPGKLRAKWDALIATEGAAIGISDCRVFLENKLVNDIFYEGFYRGRPCVVKCSSRAPDSIRNEYEMSRRLFAEAPVCAEALAYYCTGDGRMAFVVTEKLSGLSLADLMMKGLAGCDVDRFAEDILFLVQKLRAARIVHRDLGPANLIVCADGHLRVIDFQFAVRVDDYRETSWAQRHPAYLYVVFGHNRTLPLGHWNDISSFIWLLNRFPQTAAVRAAVDSLLAVEADGLLVRKPGGWTAVRLKAYRMSLLLQYVIGGGEKRTKVMARLRRFA